MNILDIAKQNSDYTIKIRRYFHEHPECGPAEQTNTMAVIKEELDKMEIPYSQVPGGGIFAYINGSSTGKTILLRSDIDALPILESETNLKNKRICISKNPGVMHGCGHDGHIAMQLTAAKILKSMEASLNGRIVLMFEEGEEGHRNIEKLLAYMAEKDMKFDTCYACHVRWDIPTGKLSCCQGSAMSGLYHFVRPHLVPGLYPCRCHL